MANNKMLSNVRDLTTAVGQLQQKIDALYNSLDKVSGKATEALGGAQEVLQSGGQIGVGQGSMTMSLGTDGARFVTTGGTGAPRGNVMANSLGGFSFSWRFNQAPGETALLNNVIGGGGGGGQGEGDGGFFDKVGMGAKPRFFGGMQAGAQFGLGLAAGAYAALPDISLLGQREIGLSQALNLGVGNRQMLDRQLRQGIGNAMSSVGADAIMAPMLSVRGFYLGTNDYNLMVSQTKSAFSTLGIDNPAAVQGLSSIYSPQVGNALYSIGIPTYQPGKGFRPIRDIAADIARITSGGNEFNMDFIRRSKAAGTFTGLLNVASGGDEAARMMLEQELVSIATGQPAQEIDILKGVGLANAAQTRSMEKLAPDMVTGFNQAAVLVDKFNDAIVETLGPLARFKGLISGAGGTNLGSAVSAAAPGVGASIGTIISELKKTNSPIEFGALSLGFGIGLSAVAGGTALATGGTGLLPKVEDYLNPQGQGGGSPGFGASFNARRLGGKGGGMYAAPEGMVTAMFGAQDNSLWASSGGKHTGTDIAMPVGTSVKAAMDGVVTSTDAGPDYGTSIVLDHGNGYQTVYGHLSERLVGLGAVVSKGQPIAKSGESGNATGPHLHYEVRFGNNNPVDPASIDMSLTAGGLTSLSPEQMGTKLSNYMNLSSSGSYAGIKGTGSQTKWASQLLGMLGAPASASNISALVTWARFEGGHWKNSAHYNPLNTTLDMGGSQSMNDIGVKRYTSWDEGLSATVKTLLGNRSSERGYAAIVDALKRDAGTSSVLSAVNQSAWVHGEGKPSNYNFPRGGGGSMTSSNDVSKTVNITVTFNQADDASALKFAKQVQMYLNNENNNSLIGSN